MQPGNATAGAINSASTAFHTYYKYFYITFLLCCNFSKLSVTQSGRRLFNALDESPGKPQKKIQARMFKCEFIKCSFSRSCDITGTCVPECNTARRATSGVAAYSHITYCATSATPDSGMRLASAAGRLPSPSLTAFCDTLVLICDASAAIDSATRLPRWPDGRSAPRPPPGPLVLRPRHPRHPRHCWLKALSLMRM